MFLFSRKRSCFYCGIRASEAPSSGARAWHCKACDATNHLDEAGNFTDVPNTGHATLSPQKKSTFSRSPSPEFDFGDDPIFCRKCQSNQHIYQQSLAEYLPDFDDPRFPEFERALPEFKKNLALRYPQVCIKCAPKAEQRLNRAMYVAKADNARHMLQNSKQNEKNMMALSLFNWRSIVIFLGGSAWWFSIFGQLLWHISEAIFTSHRYSSTGRERDNVDAVAKCVQNTKIFNSTEILSFSGANGFRNTLDTNLDCILAFRIIAGYSVVLGVLSFWWNNRLRDKIVDRRLGRMKGLGEYYQFQILTFLVRWFTLKFLDRPESMSLTFKAFRGAHTFMLIFFTLTAYQSCRMVYLDRATRINFDRQHQPLIPETQASLYENNYSPHPTLASSSSRQIDPYHQQVRERQRHEDRERVEAAVLARERSEQSPFFPYDQVAASLSRNPYIASPSSPLTPPPEDIDMTPNSSDDNVMEWTPTQARLQPRRPVQPFVSPASQRQNSAPVPEYKSPFYGTLPPAPKAPAFRLRNPTQPSFSRSTEASRNLFQDAVMGRTTETGPGFDRSAQQDDDGVEMKLRPSTWFLESDSVDTGLETAFASVFSLDDTPREVSEERGKSGFWGGLFGRI